MKLLDLVQAGIQEWQAYDRARPSLPGEHLVVAGIGLALVAAATRSDNRTTAVLQAAAGGAMLLRAASGRDGVARLFETQRRPDLAAVHAMREDAELFGLD